MNGRGGSVAAPFLTHSSAGVFLDRYSSPLANNNASCACDSRAKATLVSDDWPLLRQLLSAKHAQLPAVAVGIMEPQPDVVRARGFWTDFVAGIFNIDADLLQMRECLSYRHQVG